MMVSGEWVGKSTKSCHPTFEINHVEIAYYEHAVTRISPYGPFAQAGKQAIQPVG